MISNLFSLLLSIPLLLDGLVIQKKQEVFHPIPYSIVSSLFGYRTDPIDGRTHFHTGVDFVAEKGTAVRALGAGRVTFLGDYRGYGNLLVIRHARGFTSHYAHCQNFLVSVGQFVKGGQIIASVGRTGRATGPHLHFELRRDGRPVDPLRFIDEGL
jgi:murein DD-endopeptidase MepM/ murein hydrolase activator NlpD